MIYNNNRTFVILRIRSQNGKVLVNDPVVMQSWLLRSNWKIVYMLQYVAK
jgi:hypothetical protein